MSVVITGNDLTIDDLARVAYEHEPVSLCPQAHARMQRSRALVERLAALDSPVYGVTTGLGALKNLRIPRDQIGQFQQNILMSHAAGIGVPFDRPTVRAVMLARLNGMARGGAGVSLAVCETLLTMLNLGLHPVIPSRGSIGMSDLAPLAHMALPLIGLGEVEYQGRVMPGAEAIELAGLLPVALGAKDALALCSANSVSVGRGALVLADAVRLLVAADVSAALSLEGFQGNVGPLDPRAHAVRPFAGQRAAADHMRDLLRGSSLWIPDPLRSMQDPLSFRCVTQVHGAARDALGFVRRTIEVELNASGDNPVVLPDDDIIMSNGNFHVAGVAMGFDLLAIALAHVTSIIANRVIRLMDPALSGLPPQLTARPGINCGLSTFQKTITALDAEVRLAAAPGSVHFTPVAGDIEDHATMATLCVDKAARVVDLAWNMLSIELLTAAQAIDLRAGPQLGDGTRAAYEIVRSVAPYSADDHVLAPDVQIVADLLRADTISQVVHHKIGAEMLPIPAPARRIEQPSLINLWLGAGI